MKQPAIRVRRRIAAAAVPIVAFSCGGSTSSNDSPGSASASASSSAGSGANVGSQSSSTATVAVASSSPTSAASSSDSSGSSSGSSSSGTCTVGAMPSGGTAHTGTNLFGTADGLSWSLWSNGSGGTITTYADATAFSASWSNGGDFLTNLGKNFNSEQSYTAYGTITAQFAESRTGTGGGFSFIGIYGWMRNPCVEYYIVDDSFNGMPTNKSSVTATIDDGTYYLITNMTPGTGGNNCGSTVTEWTQMWSVRKTARQCGQITVSDHFSAWVAQGWTLGNLTSVLVNAEVGGGIGSIDFPMASVTTTQ
jgi:endo-1,4-beta-xylanase